MNTEPGDNSAGRGGLEYGIKLKNERTKTPPRMQCDCDCNEIVSPHQSLPHATTTYALTNSFKHTLIYQANHPLTHLLTH